VVIFAAIVFGQLGPVQQRTFRDSTVQAVIDFQMAPDRRYDGGPASVGPTIAAGTLSVVVGGKRRSYDLASIFPIHQAYIELPGRGGSCGAAEAIVHRGHYLAVEVVVAQKGCSATAAFVDLRTGDVSETAVVDHRWNRRTLAVPETFTGQPLRITQTDLVTLPGLNGRTPVTWKFAVIHATDASGRRHLVSFGTGKFEPGPAKGDNVLPTTGSLIWIGSIIDHGDFAVIRQMGTELIVQWTATDDLRYAQQQAKL
jgi:hypothetical protein